MNWHTVALIMAAPTLAVAFYLTYKVRHNRSEFIHNLAVCHWITANIIWMTGEFFANDTWRPYAAIFFFVGLGIISFYYIFLVFTKRKQVMVNPPGA